MGKYKSIHVKDLLLWERNPRLHSSEGIKGNEKEHVSSFFKNNEYHMKNLAADIATNNLSPNDIVVVLPYNEKFKVYEGNRRVAAIKALFRPYYLDYKPSLQKSIERISKNKNCPPYIYCYVADSIETANEIVEKTHKGINKGIGRVPWGSLEKDSFKDYQKSGETSIAYKLTQQYPDVFDEMIKELKPTNVDRILGKKVIKSIIDCDEDYSGLDSIQKQLVFFTLEHTQAIAKEKNKSIANVFYGVEEVKELLIPIIIAEKERIQGVLKDVVAKRQSASSVELILNQKTIHLTVGDSYNLLENISQTSICDISDVKVNPFESSAINIDANYNVQGDNKPGNYFVQYKLDYTKDDKEFNITKVCEIVIAPLRMKAKKVRRVFLSAPFDFELDISESVNDLITQLGTLDIEKYNLVALGSIRSLVELSVNKTLNKLAIPIQSALSVNIDSILKYILKDKTVSKKILDHTPLTPTELKNFLSTLDSDKLARQLNLLTHSPGHYMSLDEIHDIADKQLSLLLIFCSILLN